jgi:hypothetical protein
MYGPGRMGYAGGRWGSRWGYARPSPAVLLVVFFVLAAATFGHFPFFFLWWMIPFFIVPAIGLSVRGIAGLIEDRSRRPVERDLKEKELLEALARNGEITAALAALETSLSVSEADRMLSALAKEGHVEVRARDGRLAYALWGRDRRELTD